MRMNADLWSEARGSDIHDAFQAIPSTCTARTAFIPPSLKSSSRMHKSPKRKLIRQNIAAFSIVFAAAAVPRLSSGASSNWTGLGTDGNFSTAGNWSNGVPGSTTAINNTDTATFNSAGNGNTTVANDTIRNLQSFAFDTATASYTLGSTTGNAFELTNGGSISLLSTITSTGVTETFNAPLVLEPASGTGTAAYTFQNNSTDATNSLVIAGGTSVGTTSSATASP